MLSTVTNITFRGGKIHVLQTPVKTWNSTTLYYMILYRSNPVYQVIETPDICVTWPQTVWHA